MKTTDKFDVDNCVEGTVLTVYCEDDSKYKYHKQNGAWKCIMINDNYGPFLQNMDVDPRAVQYMCETAAITFHGVKN
jgi:hypothetical protein